MFRLISAFVIAALFTASQSTVPRTARTPTWLR